MKKIISVLLVLLLTFSIMTPLSVMSSAKTIDASSLKKVNYVCTKETSKVSQSGSTISSSIDYTFDSKGYLTQKVETEKSLYGSSSTQTTNSYNSMGYHTKEQIKERGSLLGGGDSTTTKTYDEKGNLTKSVKTETSFGMKETTTVTNTYDSKSNLIKTVEAYKSGSDTSTETTTKTYDESNRVIKEVYSYKDSDGYTESSSETYTFDSKGNLIKYVFTEKNSEGYSNTETTVNTFDSKGNITKEVVTVKGSELNSTATTTYTYDTKGNNTQVLSDYSDSDGYKKTAKTVRTFNADGNITKSVSERSNSENETSSVIVTYTYDSKKNLTKMVTKSTDSDGSSTTTETYAYDSKGNVTKEVTEVFEKYADGEEEYSKITTTYTYNSKSLITKTVYVIKDSDIGDMTGTITNTYDANDNLIKSVTVLKDSDSNSATNTNTYEYAPVKGALYADMENNMVYSYYNSYAYTGKAIKPGIKIETIMNKILEQGVDYKLSYTNNTNIGTAKIKVTFVGDYEDYDAVTLPFKIVLGQVKGLKATPESKKITLEWNSVAGATGYYVYEYNASTQKYTKLKTVKTNKVTISDLKPSTSHTYAVKAYKTVDKSEITGAYSSKLSVKTLKQTPEIKLSKTSATMYLGGSMTLKATTYPANVKVTWKSSDKSVATVSSSGKVTAVKNGTATITGQFTYNNKTYKVSCKVTVKTPSIKLNKTSVTVSPKASVTLKATCLPSTATVKWASSNTSVAKVSSTGKITGVKKGTATVTASFTYGSKTYKATCKVTVK